MSSRSRRTAGTARPPARRGFATVLVLMVVGVVSVILVSLQTTAWRGAAAGREELARVRAKWAARAALESTIATLAYDTIQPDQSSAMQLASDLAEVSRGRLAGASFSVSHWDDNLKRTVDGPLDPHSRLNINWMTAEALMLIPNMTEDVADEILDWIDADDDPLTLGAEISQYLSSPIPYLPRNGPMRTIQEIELLPNVLPELVRGEDWNLSGDLDPEEDDGSPPKGVFPPDNADGKLDLGWGAYLTAASSDGIDGGWAMSGQARVDLTTATSDEVSKRFASAGQAITNDQADIIQAYAANNTSATLADFIRSSLSALAQSIPAGVLSIPSNQLSQIPALTDEQLAVLLAELSIPVAGGVPAPGKVNLNTCTPDTLQCLPGIDSALADAIITERNARSSTGFTGLLDLLNVPSMTRSRLADLYPYVTVRSNAFVVVARGRDEATGTEVVIQATVDRSALPVVIRDLVIR